MPLFLFVWHLLYLVVIRQFLVPGASSEEYEARGRAAENLLGKKLQMIARHA